MKMQDKPSPTFFWNHLVIAFDPGESLAAALLRSGVLRLGAAVGGLQGRYFCGIGNCQACLVCVDGGSPVEACLTPARPGMHLTPALQVDRPPKGGS